MGAGPLARRFLSAELPRLCALNAALIGGCALEWQHDSVNGSARQDAAASAALDAATEAREDARVVPFRDVGAPEPDGAEAGAAACTDDSCGEGECNESGGCDCREGYEFNGVRCESVLCSAVVCSKLETCEVDGAATCVCKPDYTRCGDLCVDTQHDRLHCGECDYRCATGLGCEAGECEQRVHALALGDGATCALIQPTSSTTAYPLRCWGRGDYELYRRDGSSESVVPAEITDVPAARAIAMSAHRRCIIMPDSEDVRCWGRCGQDCGMRLDLIDPDENPRDLQTFASNGVRALSTADGWDWLRGVGGNTCTLSDTHDLSCRGYAVFITGSVNTPYFFAVNVDSVSNNPKVRDVSGVDLHTCAVLEDGGRVACWGDPDADLLGAESRCPDYEPGGQCSAEQSVAVYVQREDGGDLTNAVSVRAGGMLNCAVTSEQKVFCWGKNGSLGLLGAGDTELHRGAVEIAVDAAFVEVAVGATFACARTESGQVYCWGYREYLGIGDQLGDAYEGRFFSTPQPLPELPDALNVWAGAAHACARRRSGEVVCWGSNGSGQLGTGDRLPRTTPTAVQGLF